MSREERDTGCAHYSVRMDGVTTHDLRHWRWDRIEFLPIFFSFVLGYMYLDIVVYFEIGLHQDDV